MRNTLRAMVATTVVMAAGTWLATPEADGAFLLGTTVTASTSSIDLNTMSAVISDPAVEFTGTVGTNNYSFNFSDLTLQVNNTTTGVYGFLTVEFRNEAFRNRVITVTGNTFGAFSASLFGDTLTVRSSDAGNGPVTRAATVNFSPNIVPEPSSLVLASLAGGTVALAALARRIPARPRRAA